MQPPQCSACTTDPVIRSHLDGEQQGAAVAAARLSEELDRVAPAGGAPPVARAAAGLGAGRQAPQAAPRAAQQAASASGLRTGHTPTVAAAQGIQHAVGLCGSGCWAVLELTCLHCAKTAAHSKISEPQGVELVQTSRQQARCTSRQGQPRPCEQHLQPCCPDECLWQEQECLKAMPCKPERAMQCGLSRLQGFWRYLVSESQPKELKSVQWRHLQCKWYKAAEQKSIWAACMAPPVHGAYDSVAWGHCM
jgi:hypothetical protein